VKRPFPNSYWVEPGLLLAGEHPFLRDLATTRERIAGLLDVGVRCFFDLTEAGEMEDYHRLLPPAAIYESFSIPDHSVPHNMELMRSLQTRLERHMSSGVPVYVHCRAGIGRTGITIGCYLREQGEDAGAALNELNRLWQQNARAQRWPTIPETDEQADFIRNWAPHPLDVADESGQHRLQVRPLQRFRGCLVGLAVGDIYANSQGNVTAATAWTDDSAMAVAVAESLLECRGFDGRDQLSRYRQLQKNPASFGALPDMELRPVVRDVLARAQSNRSTLQGSHDSTRLDSSALARSAAAALYSANNPGHAASLAGDIARVTHQVPFLVDLCRLLSGMIAAALLGHSRSRILAAWQNLGAMPLRDDVLALAQDWGKPSVGRRRPPPPVLAVLDRAVRSFATSSSFEAGLERAAAGSGTERDAVCAVYGALAGAYYGERNIPTVLRERVEGVGRLLGLADAMFQLHGEKIERPVAGGTAA
jgi:ADP-ribosylglycohydrolase